MRPLLLRAFITITRASRSCLSYLLMSRRLGEARARGSSDSFYLNFFLLPKKHSLAASASLGRGRAGVWVGGA